MLKQKSFLSLVMSILMQMVGYVSLFFISRFMGPEPLGIISAALAFSAVFMGFSDFGYGMAHVKKVSEGKDLGKCIGVYATVKLVLVTLIGIICAVVVYVLGHTGSKLPVPPEYITVMYIMIGVSMIGGYTYIAQFTFAARLEKAKEWASLFSSKVVGSVLKSIVAVTGLGVVYLAWSGFTGAIVSAAIAFWFLFRLPVKRFDKAYFLEYTKYALPAFIIGLSSKFGQELDKLFISFFADVEQVGYYAGAKGIVQVITFINVIFVSLLLPTYSKLHAAGDIPGICSFAQKIERYISFPLVAAGVFIFFFSAPLQQMFLGDAFGTSAQIIKILTINSMLLIFAQPYTAQIMGMNRIGLATVLSIIVIAMNVLFYLVLIPQELAGISMFGFGASGAALSLTISTFIGTMVFRYYAFRLSGSKPNYIILIHLLISVMVFGPVYYLLKEWEYISNFFVLGGIAAAGGLLFIAILAAIGQFRKNDLIFYIDTLNLGKLGRYVKNEMKQ